MTNLFLIIGKNHVFGTYVKTICFKQGFENEGQRDTVINEAKAVIYSYAESFGVVHLQTIHDEVLNDDAKVFEFLEKKHTR